MRAGGRAQAKFLVAKFGRHTPLGGAINVATLTTDAGGSTAINGGSVTTSGAQSYNDTLSLGASAVFTSNAGNITLNDAQIGSGQSLTLAGGAGGDHVFALNNITSLGTLTVNGNAAMVKPTLGQ